MPNITLGKVKFIHRGAYNASTVYSKGDIVDFDNRMYIFNNDTPKNHAPIFLYHKWNCTKFRNTD